MVGMTSCWYCGTPIDDHDEVPDATLARAATSSAPAPPGLVAPPVAAPTPAPLVVPTAPVEHVTERLPTTVVAPSPKEPLVRPDRFSLRRVIAGAIVTAVLLTIGFLVMEMAMPRYTSTTPESGDLERFEIDRFGISIARPAAWKVSETNGSTAVIADEGAAGPHSTRGFRISRVRSSFTEFDDDAEDLANRRPTTEFHSLGARTEEVDDRRALVYVFAGDGLRFEQWWIDRGPRSLRLEFWSRLADDEAPAVNERIAGTFDVL